MGDGRRPFLVSSVKTKLPTRARAKDLYVSAWFRKARACVQSTGCPWGILSAEYGLLHPDEEIRPYEKTLNAMPVAERRARANEVLQSMDPFLAGIDTVVFFAGERYREFLEPGLRERGVAVSVPMLGLSLSQGGSLRGSTTVSMANRLADTRRFYELLGRIQNRLGRSRRPVECTGRLSWPRRGLDFFCEAGGAFGVRRWVADRTHRNSWTNCREPEHAVGTVV